MTFGPVETVRLQIPVQAVAVPLRLYVGAKQADVARNPQGHNPCEHWVGLVNRDQRPRPLAIMSEPTETEKPA
jgi:hypothetical protein